MKKYIILKKEVKMEPIEIKEQITERLHSMALLLDSIATLHNAGLISDEKGLEKANCYLDHIDEILNLE